MTDSFLFVCGYMKQCLPQESFRSPRLQNETEKSLTMAESEFPRNVSVTMMCSYPSARLEGCVTREAGESGDLRPL